MKGETAKSPLSPALTSGPWLPPGVRPYLVLSFRELKLKTQGQSPSLTFFFQKNSATFSTLLYTKRGLGTSHVIGFWYRLLRFLISEKLLCL